LRVTARIAAGFIRRPQIPIVPTLGILQQPFERVACGYTMTS
jgi:hypothetical protein